MRWQSIVGAVVICLADAPRCHAASEHPALDLPVWTVLPFVALLSCIAILPIAAERWWHKNRNKAIISAALAGLVALYLLAVQVTTDQPALLPLGHELFKYVSFVILLGSLFTVSGGIVLHGDLMPKPWTNAAFLAAGSLLANLIGTTGASVLLIRPLLRINRPRKNTSHLPIFFIFTVSNVGGLLTPLGDPPLFLGFLNGVPFTWTLSLWREWLLVNGMVLVLFLSWDTAAYRRESAEVRMPPAGVGQPLRLEGLLNLPLLAGIIVGVLLQGMIEGERGDAIGAALMVAMGALSLLLTPRSLRAANGFNWFPIVEVAVLFFGIFVTMVPALGLLTLHGKSFGITETWQYFWLTGGLSAFLDNAPTYLAFATLAGGENSIGDLAVRSLSCSPRSAPGRSFLEP